jgi:hypothetical protein
MAINILFNRVKHGFSNYSPSKNPSTKLVIDTSKGVEAIHNSST